MVKFILFMILYYMKTKDTGGNYGKVSSEIKVRKLW